MRVQCNDSWCFDNLSAPSGSSRQRFRIQYFAAESKRGLTIYSLPDLMIHQTRQFVFLGKVIARLEYHLHV